MHSRTCVCMASALSTKSKYCPPFSLSQRPSSVKPTQWSPPSDQQPVVSTQWSLGAPGSGPPHKLFRPLLVLPILLCNWSHSFEDIFLASLTFIIFGGELFPTLGVAICPNTVQEWSHVRKSLSTCENTPREQECCDLSFFQTRNCSWNVLPCSFQVEWMGASLPWIARYCLLVLTEYSNYPL